MVKVAVATNSSEGIAFGILQILLKRFNGVVYLTSRDEARGKAAVDKLNELGLHPEYHQLDVADRDSVTRFRGHVKEKHGGIDILVNNSEDDNTEACTEELLFPLVEKNGIILNVASECEEMFNIRTKYCVKALPETGLKEDNVADLMNWFMEGIQEGTLNFEDVGDDGTVTTNRIVNVGVNAGSNKFEINFVYNVSFKYAD